MRLVSSCQPWNDGGGLIKRILACVFWAASSRMPCWLAIFGCGGHHWRLAGWRGHDRRDAGSFWSQMQSGVDVWRDSVGNGMVKVCLWLTVTFGASGIFFEAATHQALIATVVLSLAVLRSRFPVDRHDVQPLIGLCMLHHAKIKYAFIMHTLVGWAF
jgi:hypothetical protein